MPVLYHATNEASARSIYGNGFDISRADPNGKLGAVIYFADTIEDAQNKSRNGRDGVVVANVHMHRIYETVRTLTVREINALARRGFDSAILREGNKPPVYGIFSAKQVQLLECRIFAESDDDSDFSDESDSDSDSDSDCYDDTDYVEYHDSDSDSY